MALAKDEVWLLARDVWEFPNVISPFFIFGLEIFSAVSRVWVWVLGKNNFFLRREIFEKILWVRK